MREETVLTTATQEPVVVDEIIKAEKEQPARRGFFARLAAFTKRHPWLTAVFIAL